MTLPINIEKLIKGEVEENGRIEYKFGWKPYNIGRSRMNPLSIKSGYLETCFRKEE